ncbi:MAG: hypothetical protein GFH27_549279n40 [Chloroflexi bacterium AL-W]|nr:hypothetical protein [Chloroflexi bacterium AL-N1]NOK71050.1 hypothetical protein [Chloroflexi bacterium AL-N10]NOK72727.1 hypothetical protein [Chloroflexi bacterium AL-N5]NOK79185.1 hypothetical protein [Chloroflexi bacterium AL-W]NOK87100.1 hypothetical protein [Chloroflexi bacterium AL-N15]
MNEDSSARTDRIVIDEAVHSIYKELTDGNSSEQVPFSTMKDVFMLAVALGYRQGVRHKAPSSSKVTIRKDVFKEHDLLLLKAIAIATTGDVAVLMKQDEVLTIAEEYAQAGIHEVKAELLDQAVRPLWNLVAMTQQHS